ncbi:alpha/beta fold hydrolase [Arcanobacterium pinnipediorum]|uniref:Alpha/beta hydrolase n=1 Tax=Arcanobacterium pinnipediorum TaxID=1503041 RepID=A0ABY5AEY7_9ACTO|nr:alpha/beta hydrolase [Arcanobacterium pinnipediorum]USR78774.1 alpha/beta hydrolase [Arcanobacterium pinnipediorum]
MAILFPGLALAPELYEIGFPNTHILDPWIHPWSDAPAALLERATNTPTTVIGHSLGALVALEWAIHRPELVSHLLLLDPTFPQAHPNTKPHEAFFRVGSQLAAVFSPVVGLALKPFVSQEVLTKRYRGRDNARFLFSELYHASRLESRVHHKLASQQLSSDIYVTILVGSGNADEKQFLGQQQHLATLLNARLVNLWGEKHLFPLAHPEFVQPFISPA